jgi:hypothetical protein
MRTRHRVRYVKISGLFSTAIAKLLLISMPVAATSMPSIAAMSTSVPVAPTSVPVRCIRFCCPAPCEAIMFRNGITRFPPIDQVLIVCVRTEVFLMRANTHDLSAAGIVLAPNF